MKAIPDPSQSSKASSFSQESTSLASALNAKGRYLCPVCRHGHIEQLALMDAFACDFCRHIFEANLTHQSIQVVDSTQPMLWRWDGRSWRSAHAPDEQVSVFLWLLGTVLIALPVGVVGLSLYVFPPLPGSRWAWFPLVWLACTFFTHVTMVSWLLAEHYQPTLYTMAKVRWRRWFQ